MITATAAPTAKEGSSSSEPSGARAAAVFTDPTEREAARCYLRGQLERGRQHPARLRAMARELRELEAGGPDNSGWSP